MAPFRSFSEFTIFIIFLALSKTSYVTGVPALTFQHLDTLPALPNADSRPQGGRPTTDEVISSSRPRRRRRQRSPRSQARQQHQVPHPQSFKLGPPSRPHAQFSHCGHGQCTQVANLKLYQPLKERLKKVGWSEADCQCGTVNRTTDWIPMINDKEGKEDRDEGNGVCVDWCVFGWGANGKNLRNNRMELSEAFWRSVDRYRQSTGEERKRDA